MTDSDRNMFLDENDFLRTNNNSNKTKNTDKLTEVQLHIDQVSDSARNKCIQSLEENKALDDLLTKSDQLCKDSEQFPIKARKLKKSRSRSEKALICLMVCVCILVCLLIALLLYSIIQ